MESSVSGGQKQTEKHKIQSSLVYLFSLTGLLPTKPSLFTDKFPSFSKSLMESSPGSLSQADRRGWEREMPSGSLLCLGSLCSTVLATAWYREKEKAAPQRSKFKSQILHFYSLKVSPLPGLSRRLTYTSRGAKKGMRICDVMEGVYYRTEGKS
jgi:hypothetical protein